MQKFKKLMICIFAIVCALCIYAGCGSGGGADGVTGIEDGMIYVIELGDIAAEFKSGKATLSKDGGAAAEYKSGTLITEAGEYVLVWTKGEKSETYNFTVKHKTPDAPVISGVAEGQKVAYGTAVKPTFDKGTATLSKDGGIAEPYTGGTEITEIGKYVLVVTFENVSSTVNFEITLPDYSGQMTDEFLGGVVSGDYVNSEDSILTIVNDALLIKDVNDANGYCLFRRKFAGLDLDTYPYVAFNVSEVQNASVKFGVSIEQYIGASEPSIETRAYAPGMAYLDLKTYAAARGLDTSNADLWLQISLEGKEFAAGELTAVLESIQSVTEIPAEQPAGQYIDNTAETLSQWVANTAKFSVFAGQDQALGTVVDSESYGKVLKRVQFNTKAYPYLVVDVAEPVDGWKIEALSYEDNLYVGEKTTIFAQSKRTGKVEVNLQQLFGEDECVDLVLEFYIVGKSEEKFFTLNGLYTSADPLYAPVISGIAEGDIYNAAVHGDLKPTFDKGTATLSKDGGAAAAFASGDAIAEAGEYTLTVKAGATKVTEVTFTVIEQDYGENVIEDFLTESKFTVENATFDVIEKDGEYAPTFVKLTESEMAKLISRGDFDFRTDGVLVFEVYAGEGFDVAGFGFELLDDVNWYRVLGKGNTADCTEEIKDADQNVIGYKFYYRIIVAKHTGSDATMSWAGALKENLKLSISLEADKSVQKTAVLKSLAIENTYPGEEEGGDTPVTPEVIGTLKEDFDSIEGFTSSNGKSESVNVVYDEEKDEIVLTLTANDSDQIKLSKKITYNFAEHGKYLVLVFETNGYTPDAGFSLSLRDENAGPWRNVQVRYPDFTFAETTALANGRMQYVCYIEISGLTDMGEPNEFHDYSAVASAELFTEIVVEYGANKTVYLKYLSQTDTLPEAAQPGMIETYGSAAGFTVAELSAKWGYDAAKDEVFFTKAADAPATKLSKEYTFNFAKGGKYLVLTFETNGYTPDAGFSVALLNKGVAPWEELKINADNFALKQTTALANGRTQYVCYIEITGGTDLDEPFETSDWTTETSIKLNLDIIIEFGAEKTVYLQSLRQTDTLPSAAEE